ncbi:MAG: asparagine synthase (glutamine-hydrolyzing) [Acidobacteria bacterium]|nr:MAG: asparagine synthase (glutamine-hydrolyzing) [Acidobacteriota bacterium]
MCGICGILAIRNGVLSAPHVEAMSRSLRHRGPDDSGLLILPPVAFGFRRLSIVDPSGGHQPMSNEDQSVWIVFNGEIYNHPKLRPILETRGHRYVTNSDTETILHLYEEYGEDCVHHLQGMFAFAIWDRVRRKLFCARDRLGIKPFYYATTAGDFVFASEIKALLEVPGLRHEVNRRALPEFFAFGYLSSAETLFKDIYKLLPGHRLSIDLNAEEKSPHVTQYWDLDISRSESSVAEADYVNQFDSLFTETIRMHLMSDVPLGVFLSGGLDSSAIAAVVADLRKDAIQTFAVGYKEDSFSELPFARQVASHIGAVHNEVVLGPNDFIESLPQLIWHEDEPLVWPSSVALYYVARLANQKVKVVLTGEGADEVFAGYLKYRATLWNMRAAPVYKNLFPNFAQDLAQKLPESRFVPDWIRRKLRHSFVYYRDSFEKIHFDNFYSVFSGDQQRELFSDEVDGELREINPYKNSMRYSPSKAGNGDLLNQLLYLDIKTYLVELLMKQDQMSMAASIESRVPFLDHKLVEWVAQLPANQKVRGLSGKYLLRRTMARRLPKEIIRRNKRGFPTPIRPWLRYQLFDKLTSVLTDGRMAERRLFRPGYVETLLNAHRQGFSDATERCWRLLNFELWNRIFLDRDQSAFHPGMNRSESAMVAA